MKACLLHIDLDNLSESDLDSESVKHWRGPRGFLDEVSFDFCDRPVGLPMPVAFNRARWTDGNRTVQARQISNMTQLAALLVPVLVPMWQ